MTVSKSGRSRGSEDVSLPQPLVRRARDVAAFAHLFELPNKIHLSGDNYLIVQQVYRGWAILGAILDPGALITTLILAVLMRRERRHFVLALIAFLCIAGTLAVFFAFTFPVNQATDNWTTLPQDWQRRRAQWEYSHAARAGLTLVAFAALVLSALAREPMPARS